ncbi:hypothetical protein GCM10009663_36800 [Kitasatospora arboriphila]|uniref:Alpha/beta hydrolase fold-3 domain-containing protein n=1 Tax=Kitasatospora arboriphila TaxID=258052 RepID=A0ABN1TLS7_9ACTN
MVRAGALQPLAALPGLPAGDPVRRARAGRRPVRTAVRLHCHRGVRPNRDEALAYGLRLLQAGVSVELHQWPGTFHGSQAILSAEI